MVRESIESFANEDLRKTKEVIAYDDVIDDMLCQVKKELADGILNGEATQETDPGYSDDRKVLRAHRRSRHKYRGVGRVCDHRRSQEQ